MSVKLSDFASGVTLTDTDHVVGYSNTNTGGERKWTVANLRNSLITGAATTIDTENLTASRALISNASGKVDVSDVTSTEIGYLDGVTSGIQAQLNNKQATITGAATTVTSSDLTTDRVLISNGSGKIAASTISTTDLSNITSAAIPTGTVMYFATSTAPSGWEQCNGAALTTALGASYTALRNLLLGASSPYGVSSGNPLLPDLRGYFIRGFGTNGDTTTSGTFGEKQADALQGHWHAFGQAAGFDCSNDNNACPADIIQTTSGGTTTEGVGSTTLQGFKHVRNATNDGANGNPRIANETRSKNIAMLPCIKL